MATKTNPLAQALNKAKAPASAVAATDPAPARPSKRPSSRDGRVLIGGFFAPEVQTALKHIAADHRTTIQALLTEGINTVLAKHGKSEIAGMTPKAASKA
jgi:hypothetical protein